MIHGADVIIQVIDARDPEGTRLPLAEKWSGVARLMTIANKADLLIGDKLPDLPRHSFRFSAKTSKEEQRIELIEKIMKKSQKRPIHAILIGYPNVGKSTLINFLAHRKAARISPVAGTTKDLQWVKINEDLIISDYRGIFPSREKKDDLVRKHALNITTDSDYSIKLAEKIVKNPKLLMWICEYFDLNSPQINNSEELLSEIAKRRGWFIKKGELNLTEAGKSLMRAMMEAPEMV